MRASHHKRHICKCLRKVISDLMGHQLHRRGTHVLDVTPNKHRELILEAWHVKDQRGGLKNETIDLPIQYNPLVKATIRGRCKSKNTGWFNNSLGTHTLPQIITMPLQRTAPQTANIPSRNNTHSHLSPVHAQHMQKVHQPTPASRSTCRTKRRYF